MRRSARYSRRPRAECTAHARYRRRGKSAEICQIHACRRADGAKEGIILRFQCRGTDRSAQGWTGSYFLLFCCWDNILCLLSIVRYERKVKRDTRTAQAVRPNGAAAFSAPAEWGVRTALACSPRPGGFFSAPESRGTRTASACSPFPGGKFSAEPQRGVALCGARGFAAPRGRARG